MDRPLEASDYYIYVMELPKGIHAMIIPNDDSTFSLYLDPRRDFMTWIDDYTHELWHILRDDFYSDKPIYVIEGIA